MPPVELYVYYRVAAERCAAALGEIQALQAGLRAELAGLEARLLQRSEAPEGQGYVTWMEIYRLPGGLDDIACARIEAAGRAHPQGRIGPRVTERFQPVVGALPLS